MTNQVYNEIKIAPRNITYGDYNIILPDGSTLSGDFVSIAGENVSTNVTRRLGNSLDSKTIVPEVNPNPNAQKFEVIRDGGDHDSERKAMEYIVKLMEQRSGINIEQVPSGDRLVGFYEGEGFSGAININTEMSPCKSCTAILGEQFQKLFGDDIQINIRNGVEFEESPQ